MFWFVGFFWLLFLVFLWDLGMRNLLIDCQRGGEFKKINRINLPQIFSHPLLDFGIRLNKEK